MSIQAVAWALDQDLPARPKLVLVSIANHANHTDGYCWLRADTIAAEASCTPRAVFNFVGDLIRNGYVRKAPRRAADGRQRANDYWILFNREPRDWQVRGEGGQEPEAEIDDGQEGEAAASAEAEAQDVVEPDERRACGENPSTGPEQPDEKHALSSGPHEHAFRHTDAEPSKTNPEKRALPTGPPRGYHPPPPPPPQPMGSTTGNGSGEFVFVFKPSRAYDAWAKHKEAEWRKNGEIRKFQMATYRNGRLGWWFPSLFPPDDGGTELASGEEIDEFGKTG